MHHNLGRLIPSLRGLKAAINATSLLNEYSVASWEFSFSSPGITRSIIGMVPYNW